MSAVRGSARLPRTNTSTLRGWAFSYERGTHVASRPRGAVGQAGNVEWWGVWGRMAGRWGKAEARDNRLRALRVSDREIEADPWSTAGAIGVRM